MIKAIKRRLAHVSPDSLRYRLARSAVKEEKLRKAHACTFYWVYLPAAVLRFVVLPIIEAVALVISYPIAYLAGYKRSGEAPHIFLYPIDTPDDFIPDFYVNAHRKVAPWRILLVLSALAVFVAALITGGKVLLISLGILLAIIAVATAIGWLVWSHWANVTEVWDRICPRLEVEGKNQ